MPLHVIQLVKDMETNQNQLIMADGVPNFTWRPGVPVAIQNKSNPQDDISVQREDAQMDINKNEQEEGEQEQDHIIEENVQDKVEHISRVSDNSDGESDNDDAPSCSYDEDSYHKTSVESSFEGNHRLPS